MRFDLINHANKNQLEKVFVSNCETQQLQHSLKMKSFHVIKNVILSKNCSKLKKQIAQTSVWYSSDARVSKRSIEHVPNIKEFISTQSHESLIINGDEDVIPPYMDRSVYQNDYKNVYFETYGCQMNVNDTELAWAILQKQGFIRTEDVTKANVILLVTCAIREKAESKIWNRINALKKLRQNNPKGFPKIGLLGCMAERLKKNALEQEKSIDIIAGPDSYRDLPRLVAECTENSTTAINVMLSVDETYADIMPVRFNLESKTAFVSIMRGCDNMCSYCIVPFTRGRERSRPISSIVDEVKQLSDQGIRQVTVLGQNVNSYRDLSEQQFAMGAATNMSKGFKTIYKTKHGGLRFADLLEQISNVDKNMRIRFTSPHPKDFPDEVLHLINERANICNQIHLPAQSGSTSVLQAMRRGYTRDDYDELVEHIRNIVPNVSLSTDMISGFCGETEEDHLQTLDLVNDVKYDYGFFFAYSMRKKTHAYHKMHDDVEESVKMRRLNEVLAAYKSHVPNIRKPSVGETQLVLVESVSRKSQDDLSGRNDGNIKVIFPRHIKNETANEEINIGDYITVKIKRVSSNCLIGEPLSKTNIEEFQRYKLLDTID